MGGVLSWVQDYWQGEIFVAVLGLDCAGKSALVHRLQYKDVEEPLPTMGFFVHTLRVNNTLMKVADVAGQDSMRGLWSVMYHRADGIIYVIDGKDIGRLPLAISELKKVMDYPALEDKPFLILVNKHDLVLLMLCSGQERTCTKDCGGHTMSLSELVNAYRKRWRGSMRT